MVFHFSFRSRYIFDKHKKAVAKNSSYAKTWSYLRNKVIAGLANLNKGQAKAAAMCISSSHVYPTSTASTIFIKKEVLGSLQSNPLYRLGYLSSVKEEMKYLFICIMKDKSFYYLYSIILFHFFRKVMQEMTIKLRSNRNLKSPELHHLHFLPSQ